MYHQRFKTTDDRFDEKYDRHPSGCWIWKTGADHEYPKFWVGGYIRASHFAWERANGRKLRPDELICHHCDTPRCVNPDHLFIGDVTANMRDRSRKGRGNHPAGELNGRARITRELADRIRKEYAGGLSQQKIADKYAIGQTTVSNVIRRVRWTE